MLEEKIFPELIGKPKSAGNDIREPINPFPDLDSLIPPDCNLLDIPIKKPTREHIW